MQRRRVVGDVGGEIVDLGVGGLAVPAKQFEGGVGVDPVGSTENAFGLLDDRSMLGGSLTAWSAAARVAPRRSVVRLTT